MTDIQLIHGDCLEKMKDIPDGSIDFILTDPPYGTTACKWDSVIPFEPMWEQIWRVLKPNGACALFGSEPFSSHLRMSQIKNFKYDWFWKKSYAGNFIQAKNMPLIKYEIISIFSKGSTIHKGQSQKRINYYPQGTCKTEITLKNSEKFMSTSEHRYGRPSHKKYYKQNIKDFPISIIEFKSSGNKIHPTQKPVALLEYLIKTYTLEGETVLDFTMGSGSTGVACANLNRKFIGIEKDEKYFEIAKQRIKEANDGI